MDWTDLEQLLDPNGIGSKHGSKVRLVRLRKAGNTWIRDIWFKDKESKVKDLADRFISSIEEYACRRVVEIGDDV